MRFTLCEIGPSISVTSFTNIVAFLVGASISPLQIRLFCLCTALAFFIAWYLQMFLSAPVLVLTTKPIYFVTPHDSVEQQQREEAKKVVKLPNNDIVVSPPQAMKYHTYDDVRLYVCDFNSDSNPSLSLRYVKWINCTWTKLSVLFLLVLLWFIAAIGVFNMQTTFSPEKTFDSRSHLVQSVKILDQKHETLILFIEDLPSLQTPSDVREFRQSFNELRSAPYLCPNGGQLWLDMYDQFWTEGNFGNENATSHRSYFDAIPDYIALNPDIQDFIHFNQNKTGTVTVSAIAMEMCVRGATSWSARAHLLADVRRRAMPVLGSASVYSYDSAILDLILTTGQMTLQSTLTTVACMAVVCLLFIPNLLAIIVCVLSMISIAFVVTGGLSWWGCDMDVIAMVDIIMTVGLCIDFQSHVTYHFFVSQHHNVVQRLHKTLSTVAFPMLQAASTTVLCVAPLFFYDIYMFTTFVKTILLSVSVGLFHALLILPIFLQFF